MAIVMQWAITYPQPNGRGCACVSIRNRRPDALRAFYADMAVKTVEEMRAAKDSMRAVGWKIQQVRVVVDDDWETD